MRHRLRYRLEQNVQLINDWKKHFLRTVHQDVARKHILDQIDETSVFLIADWAMKWLPTRYREAQERFVMFSTTRSKMVVLLPVSYAV
jgi:hypothetical protein